MKRQPFLGLSIRTGVVRDPTVGYLLACDPKMEEEEVPHTKVFKWSGGTFRSGDLNFNAHSCCVASTPEFALVMLAAEGEYGISTERLPLAGNIFKNSGPKPKIERYGVIRSVTEIAGKAYAIGFGGSAFRLDSFARWTRIDQGLPTTFRATAIHGFDDSDIYAVGYSGEMWHFDGNKWDKLDLPTNLHLHAIKCSPDGGIYVAGRAGILIHGNKMHWEVIANGGPTQNFWDLEWFEGGLWVSSNSSIYRLEKGELKLVDLGQDKPKTCYHLSATKEVMWSIGAEDVIAFDGKSWLRII
jgi:hypothetical protein